MRFGEFMPFAGIPAGSKLETKIDRCVAEVMARGRSKSSAIAICRSAIEKKDGDYSDPDKRRKAARGFGAKRGEQIRGQLFRGTGGKFSKGGNGGADEDNGVSAKDVRSLKRIDKGLKLKASRLAELRKKGLVDASGKLTTKGKKAAGVKAGGAAPKAEEEKKPKKGRGGGGKKKKPSKRDQDILKLAEGLSDQEKSQFRKFASGDLDKLSTTLLAKMVRLGFMSGTADSQKLTAKYNSTDTRLATPSPASLCRDCTICHRSLVLS